MATWVRRRRHLFFFFLAGAMLVLLGTAGQSEVSFTAFYEGPFHVVDGSDPAGILFVSFQSSTDTSLPVPENNVEWRVDTTVDPNIIFDGNASFDGPEGVLTGEFAGTAPLAPPGQDYQEAFVTIDFTEGTGIFGGATGSADVEAQLSFAGISSGTVSGVVRVPTPVPTLSQWSLIILFFLFLVTGSVLWASKRSGLALASGTGTVSVGGTTPLLVRGVFLKSVVSTLVLAVIGIAVVVGTLGSVSRADVIGTLISAILVGYLIHFLIVTRDQS